MIPHNLPTFGAEEQHVAAKVIESGWVAQGREVEAFENEICRFLGLSDGHCVVVSSGSSALFLALWVLDGQNKSVGVPVYSCSALRNAIGLIQGHPVYLDCASDGPNLDVDQALRAGLDILISPSIFGLPAEIPNQAGLKVIEDLAQSLGAIAADTRIGLRGDIGICSFYATKMMTSGGQGGAVFSRDKNLIDQIRDYRDFDGRNDVKLRFNFQMTDLQAAIGRVQLKRLPEFIERRESIFNRYKSAGLDLLDIQQATDIPVRYRILMRCQNPADVILRFRNEGVRVIVPVEEGELLDDPRKYPMASVLTRTLISLPAYPSLSDRQVDHIIRVARAVS